jgi:hypothetical protein
MYENRIAHGVFRDLVNRLCDRVHYFRNALRFHGARTFNLIYALKYDLPWSDLYETHNAQQHYVQIYRILPKRENKRAKYWWKFIYIFK